MGSPEKPDPGQAQQEGLTELERLVLAALQEANEPMDPVALAAAASLDVDETLKAVQGLKEKGLVRERPPEPIRERFQVA